MPIEANVWGTPKSSGSFSNLFKIRLLRAIDYRDSPFEITLNSSGKAHGCSDVFSGVIEEQWPMRKAFKSRGIYLSCGSSDETALPDKCADFVVTDPPFFDNVHYSELADFFYAWQSLHPRGFINGASTTRNQLEVQDVSDVAFAAKLRAVFVECHRIIKDDGLLVFSYHHSRAEGWISLAEAVYGAGFTVANIHPVKAEMSVATPKTQTKEPIQLDIILVCHKLENDARMGVPPAIAIDKAIREATMKAARLRGLGLRLSRNDCRIMIYSQFLAELGRIDEVNKAVVALSREASNLESAAVAMSSISAKSNN
jgi:putative DNA methylase